MQELVFNTAKKTVMLNNDHTIYEFNNIPTVKMVDGYYEVIQEENGIKYPVLRVPISNTNMLIERYDKLISK